MTGGLAGPGSAIWLLAHELRLGWRGVWSAGKTRRRRILFGLLAVGLLCGAFALGIPFALFVRRIAIEPSPLLYAGIDFGMAVIASLMVAQSLNAATLALYERRDLDLLLSSPISATRVLTVRALAIAVSSVAIFVALATPFAVSLAIVGEPRWLSIYPVLLSLALGATAIGLAVAMGLFALIGPKATRILAQILAALIGASFFLLSQAGNMGAGRARGRAFFDQAEALATSGAFEPGRLATWPARALLGEPLPLLIFAAVGVGLFALATTLLGRRFAADAAAAAGVGSRARRRRLDDTAIGGFQAGVTGVLVRKELKLLSRDPFLISQVLMQLLYLIPLAFVIWRNAFGRADATAAAGTAGVVFLAAQLTGNLAWITVSAEDAPDLIASSPLGKAQADRAKAIAAVLPVAVVIALPILGLAVLSPIAGFAALAGAAAAGGSSALINIWHQRPGQRRDFRKSRRSSWIVSLAETGVAFSWAAAAALLALLQPWWLIPACVGAGVVVLLRRPEARA